MLANEEVLETFTTFSNTQLLYIWFSETSGVAARRGETEEQYQTMESTQRDNTPYKYKAFSGLGSCENVLTERSIFEYANLPKL